MDRLRAATTAISLLALVGGCKVGPDYCCPPTNCMQDSWRQTDDPTVQMQYTSLASWWTKFEDPTLNALVDRAVRNNLDLREAALRIFEARARRCIVRGDLFPHIQQDGSYSYAKTSSAGIMGGGGIGGFTFGTASDQWSLGLNGTWEVDVFGRLRRLIEAADEDIAASVEDYRDTMVILLGDVATNYVDARSYQRGLEIARENLEVQQQTLDMTEKRARGELSPQLDVDQAKANRERTAAGIPLLVIGYQQSLNRLSVLLGCPPGEVDRLLAEQAPIPIPPGEIAIGIPADLLRRRPDIRKAEREIAAQTARIGAAIGEMYPKFSLFGSFGLDAQDFGKLFSGNAIAASTGPQMQWSILNFGRLRCNVNIQQSLQQQYVVRYQKTVLAAAEDVDNALVSYVQQKQRRTHLQNEVEANRSAVALSQQRYIGGDVDFQRVLDSQRSLLSSEEQLASTEASVATAVIQLYRALGGGWQAAESQSGDVATGELVPPGAGQRVEPELIETPMSDGGL